MTSLARKTTDISPTCQGKIQTVIPKVLHKHFQ